MTRVFCSVSHVRRRVKLKGFHLLHAAPLISVSSETVDQSEEPGGGASVASFCLQKQTGLTVLFDDNMPGEAFCAALFKIHS